VTGAPQGVSLASRARAAVISFSPGAVGALADADARLRPADRRGQGLTVPASARQTVRRVLDARVAAGYHARMSEDRQSQSDADGRNERLRAALRENLARRKAQARARRSATDTATAPQDDTEGKKD